MTDTVTLALIPARGLKAAIKDLHSTGRAWQEQSHRVACSILKHLGKTKDVRHTAALLKDMPEAIRTNGLRMWLEEFGPVRFTSNEERKAGAPEIVVVKGKATRMGEAMAKPYWKFKATEGAAYVPMDLHKEIERFTKRLERDAKETGVDHTAFILALKTFDAPTVQQ